jgi:dTDP-4-amino-4,6-dideoxygalactose transaminase
MGAGTIGHFGSFSLQSSKTLTSGEGGILLCKSPEHAALAASIVDCGRPHALGGGGDDPNGLALQGGNFRMGELQSALALAGIERFPAQSKQREEMAAYMDEALSEIKGVRLLKRDERHTTRSFYRYIFAIDPGEFGVERDVLCGALDAEGVDCWVGYQAMHNYDLFQPQKSRLAVPNAFPEFFDFKNMHLPEATRACEQEAVWLDESIFRAGPKGVDDVVAAIKKIQRNAEELNAAAGELKRKHGR